MRTVFVTVGVVALVSTGFALAAPGPPQPPQPATTTAATTPPSTSPSGLHGYVSRGPTTPNCSVTMPCFHPAHVTLRFTRSAGGPLVGTVLTRTTGAYRIALTPGLYRVSVRANLGRLKPGLVLVPATGSKRLDFVLSTGIY